MRTAGGWVCVWSAIWATREDSSWRCSRTMERTRASLYFRREFVCVERRDSWSRSIARRPYMEVASKNHKYVMAGGDGRLCRQTRPFWTGCGTARCLWRARRGSRGSRGAQSCCTPTHSPPIHRPMPRSQTPPTTCAAAREGWRTSSLGSPPGGQGPTTGQGPRCRCGRCWIRGGAQWGPRQIARGRGASCCCQQQGRETQVDVLAGDRARVRRRRCRRPRRQRPW